MWGAITPVRLFFCPFLDARRIMGNKPLACGILEKSGRQKDEADEAQLKCNFWSGIADDLGLSRKS